MKKKDLKKGKNNDNKYIFSKNYRLILYCAKPLKKRTPSNYVKSGEKLIASLHLYFDSKQV